jgi:hypothetical protein
MMEIKLGYKYRADGMFLVQKRCVHCGESFDVCALSNCQGYPWDVLCEACKFVLCAERAFAASCEEGGA